MRLRRESSGGQAMGLASFTEQSKDAGLLQVMKTKDSIVLRRPELQRELAALVHKRAQGARTDDDDEDSDDPYEYGSRGGCVPCIGSRRGSRGRDDDGSCPRGGAGDAWLKASVSDGEATGHEDGAEEHRRRQSPAAAAVRSLRAALLALLPLPRSRPRPPDPAPDPADAPPPLLWRHLSGRQPERPILRLPTDLTNKGPRTPATPSRLRFSLQSRSEEGDGDAGGDGAAGGGDGVGCSGSGAGTACDRTGGSLDWGRAAAAAAALPNSDAAGDVSAFAAAGSPVQGRDGSWVRLLSPARAAAAFPVPACAAGDVAEAPEPVGGGRGEPAAAATPSAAAATPGVRSAVGAGAPAAVGQVAAPADDAGRACTAGAGPPVRVSSSRGLAGRIGVSLRSLFAAPANASGGGGGRGASRYDRKAASGGNIPFLPLAAEADAAAASPAARGASITSAPGAVLAAAAAGASASTPGSGVASRRTLLIPLRVQVHPAALLRPSWPGGEAASPLGASGTPGERFLLTTPTGGCSLQPQSSHAQSSAANSPAGVPASWGGIGSASPSPGRLLPPHLRRWSQMDSSGAGTGAEPGAAHECTSAAAAAATAAVVSRPVGLLARLLGREGGGGAGSGGSASCVVQGTDGSAADTSFSPCSAGSAASDGAFLRAPPPLRPGPQPPGAGSPATSAAFAAGLGRVTHRPVSVRQNLLFAPEAHAASAPVAAVSRFSQPASHLPPGPSTPGPACGSGGGGAEVDEGPTGGVGGGGGVSDGGGASGGVASGGGGGGHKRLLRRGSSRASVVAAAAAALADPSDAVSAVGGSSRGGRSTRAPPQHLADPHGPASYSDGEDDGEQHGTEDGAATAAASQSGCGSMGGGTERGSPASSANTRGAAPGRTPAARRNTMSYADMSAVVQRAVLAVQSGADRRARSPGPTSTTPSRRSLLIRAAPFAAAVGLLQPAGPGAHITAAAGGSASASASGEGSPAGAAAAPPGASSRVRSMRPSSHSRGGTPPAAPANAPSAGNSTAATATSNAPGAAAATEARAGPADRPSNQSYAYAAAELPSFDLVLLPDRSSDQSDSAHIHTWVEDAADPAEAAAAAADSTGAGTSAGGGSGGGSGGGGGQLHPAQRLQQQEQQQASGSAARCAAAARADLQRGSAWNAPQLPTSPPSAVHGEAAGDALLPVGRGKSFADLPAMLSASLRQQQSGGGGPGGAAGGGGSSSGGAAGGRGRAVQSNLIRAAPFAAVLGLLQHRHHQLKQQQQQQQRQNSFAAGSARPDLRAAGGGSGGSFSLGSSGAASRAAGQMLLAAAAAEALGGGEHLTVPAPAASPLPQLPLPGGIESSEGHARRWGGEERRQQRQQRPRPDQGVEDGGSSGALPSDVGFADLDGADGCVRGSSGGHGGAGDGVRGGSGDGGGAVGGGGVGGGPGDGVWAGHGGGASGGADPARRTRHRAVRRSVTLSALAAGLGGEQQLDRQLRELEMAAALLQL